jgi:hypothetical protein
MPFLKTEVNAMGIFRNLAPRGWERKIEDQYVAMFQMAVGMSPPKAKSTVRHTIKEAREESLKEYIPGDLPEKVGDFLLEGESTDKTIKSSLAKKRKEGVRDEDIRWWFNMDDLERSILLKLDDVTRHALFTKLRQEDGLSEGEAANGVRRRYPVFGDPDDTTVATGEDRPLPYELKDRIRSFVKKRMQRDPEAFKKEIKGSLSFNALIRGEVKKGNI